jgi:hypothetical protein
MWIVRDFFVSRWKESFITNGEQIHHVIVNHWFINMRHYDISYSFKYIIRSSDFELFNLYIILKTWAIIIALQATKLIKSFKIFLTKIISWANHFRMSRMRSFYPFTVFFTLINSNSTNQNLTLINSSRTKQNLTLINQKSTSNNSSIIKKLAKALLSCEQITNAN